WLRSTPGCSSCCTAGARSAACSACQAARSRRQSQAGRGAGSSSRARRWGPFSWPPTITGPIAWARRSLKSGRAWRASRAAPITGELIQPPAANLLLGLVSHVLVDPNGRIAKYNSALLLNENGSRGERYDKIHRVPFGEYVPFRDWLPWMDTFAPYETDYSIS